MIYQGTYVNIIDNSGGRKGKCIKILNKSYKKGAKVGDIIVISLKKIKTSLDNTKRLKIKKGDVMRALVVSTKKKIVRSNFISITFYENNVVLVNNKNMIIGTRVIKPVCREVIQKGYVKIGSLTQFIF